MGDLVDADAHHQREVGDEREDRVGPDVRRDAHPQRRDRPVVLDGGLEVGDLITPVRGRQHVLEPRLAPAQGEAVEAREDGERGVLRVAAELHAETAAHLGRDHADHVLRKAERRREVVPEAVGRLVRRPEGEAARRRIRDGERGARLERDAAEPLTHHPLLHDAPGLAEDRVGIACLDLVPVLDVVGRVRVEPGRALRHRLEGIGHGGQDVPVHGDVGRGVHRDRFARRDDGGDRLAHVEHAVHGECPVLAPDARGGGAAALGARAAERQWCAEGLDVRARDDLEHAGAPGRLRGVDLPDPCMGVGAPDEDDVVQSGRRHVGDVGRAARDQPRVFLALDFRTHQPRRRHRGSFQGN